MLDLNTSFHVRGLVRLLDEEINAVRRELLNLQDAGILKSQKDGNKLVYRIDKRCHILQELRSMFFKESEIGTSIMEAIDSVDGISLVVLTESFLKKRYENKTDVDFLFIGNMKVRDLTTAMSSVEKNFGKELRFSAITKEDFNFARKKQEPFLMNVLEKDKIIMFGQLSDLL